MSNEKTSDVPVDPQMPGSTDKALSLPITSVPAHYASKADEFLLRLNKLIRTNAGLSSVLSITAYSLYIASYLHVNSPTRAQILSKISQLLGRPAPKLPAAALQPSPAGVTPFTPLTTLVNDTRFSMRILSLVPLYALLRSLLRTQKPKDILLHRFALIQASAYITFQALENVWLLGTRGVVSNDWLEKRGVGVGVCMKWSCRAWLLAICMDFARLIREAVIAKQQGTANLLTQQEQEQVERKWFAEFFTASAWFPMALHYSLPGGIGMNQGTVGVSGMLGGMGGLRKAWAATKD